MAEGVARAVVVGGDSAGGEDHAVPQTKSAPMPLIGDGAMIMSLMVTMPLVLMVGDDATGGDGDNERWQE